MELDDLKNIWRQNTFTEKNDEEIAAMLKKKSKSVINKIRLNILFELVFTGIAVCILLYYIAVPQEGAVRWTFISFVILFIGYTIYYIKKLNLLRQFESSHQNIKSELEKLTTDLQSYINFYTKSYTFIYPFYVLLTLIFVGLDRGLEGIINLFRDPTAIIALTILILVFIIATFWFTKWYVGKLYGRHLDKLNQILKDLISDPE